MSLTPDGYIPRLVDSELQTMLHSAGCVYVVGPKWCGKTWVSLNASNSAFMVGSSNDVGTSNKERLDMNIRLALDGEYPRLIDEWQDVPRVWDAVRSEVDSIRQKGAFILTGSSTSKDVRPVHSGTGRIIRLEMRTMSLYEMGESNGKVSLSDILCGNSIGIYEEQVTIERIAELVLSGGWPDLVGTDFEYRLVAIRGYLDLIIEDASELDGKHRKKTNLRMVMNSLARNETTLASTSKIHMDTGMPLTDRSLMILDGEAGNQPALSIGTVEDYLDVFNRLHLINNQPAFDPNIKSSRKVRKTSKRHLADPSIALAALEVGKERLIEDLISFGYYFEALVERDLDVYARYLGGKLYHYRDDTGMEVDAVIELPDGRWGAFEIKLGANKIEKAAEDLKRFRQFMEKGKATSLPSCLCVICGLSSLSYRREDGVYVVPITALKP